MILTREEPVVRVRKLMDSWCVQRWFESNGIGGWEFVAAYTSWPIAYAVAQVEASPKDWPLHFHEREY